MSKKVKYRQTTTPTEPYDVSETEFVDSSPVLLNAIKECGKDNGFLRGLATMKAKKVKAKVTPHLSLNPQHINEGAWYYEEEKGIEIVYEIVNNGQRLRTDHILIPWKTIVNSVKRYRRLKAAERELKARKGK